MDRTAGGQCMGFSLAEKLNNLKVLTGTVPSLETQGQITQHKVLVGCYCILEIWGRSFGWDSKTMEWEVSSRPPTLTALMCSMADGETLCQVTFGQVDPNMSSVSLQLGSFSSFYRKF